MLHVLCDRFRARFQWLAIQLVSCRWLVASLLIVAGAIAIDWWQRPAVAGRWTILAIVALAIVGATVWLLRPLRRRWTDAEVLTYLDAVDPHGADRLISLHELAAATSAGAAATPEGRQFLELAVAQLTPAAKTVSLDGALRRDGVRRWQGRAGALAAIAAALVLCCPEQTAIALQRIFLPWTAAKWPTLTTLAVEEPGGGWRIPQGEDFRLVVRVEGARPAEVEIVHRSPSADYWTTDRVPVDASGKASYTFQAVAEPVTFYLRGGDDRTDKMTLDIIERPRIRKITAYYTYPSYAGLANRRSESGQLHGVEGTEVKIDFETYAPLASARFALVGGAEEELALSSPTTFSKTLQLRQDGQYVIKLTDPQGFREARPERYDIQVLPDHPPEVRLLAPGRDLVATPQANLKFAFEAHDDFGLERVEFLYAIRPNGKPLPLSDQITGPIAQTGKESRAEFTWDFTKLELKHNVDVEYWVAAADCNPTGRGTSQSPHFKISLLTPTDFHNQILYEAKKVLAEARIAYLNQKKAYWLGSDWLAAGMATGEAWNQLVETQETAARAAEAVKRWMRELKEHMGRNRMQDALMEQRLAAIEDLRAGAEEQLAAARGMLIAAHPKNSSEAEPERLRTARRTALAAAADRQKLAAAGLGRMLRKLYDWENLQTALVNTRLLRERQEEIQEAARQIAPTIVGREAQDLDEKTLDRILSLSQKQKTALEAETNLENQLAAIALKADSEGRASVRRYLLTAFGYLREIRVNSAMKSLTAKIADNQLSEVAKEQEIVTAGLKVVEGTLMAAGKNADNDQDAGLADLLKREQADVEVVRVEPAKAATGSEETVQVNEAAVKKLLNDVVPAGDDALSQALLALADAQDDVRGRTAYLAGTLTGRDMPRYQRLHSALLQHLQREVEALAKDRVLPLLEKSEHAPRLKPWFEKIRAEITIVQGLLEANQLGASTRGLQEDIIAGSRDLTQFLARTRQIRDLAAEHGKNGGVDNFNRPYLLKGDDLAKAVSIHEELEWARTLQASVGRASDWLASEKGKPPAAQARDKVRDAAGLWQESVAKHVGAAKARLAGFSEAARDPVRALEIGTLPDETLAQIGQKLRRDEIDRALRTGQDQAQEKMSEALQRMKALVDARVVVVAKQAPTEPAKVAVQPPTTEPAVEPVPAPPVFLTEDELARQTTPEVIKSTLEKTKNLPPEIKARMLRELPSEFPERYRRLIGAYYRDLLDNRPDARKGAMQP